MSLQEKLKDLEAELMGLTHKGKTDTGLICEIDILKHLIKQYKGSLFQIDGEYHIAAELPFPTKTLRDAAQLYSARIGMRFNLDSAINPSSAFSFHAVGIDDVRYLRQHPFITAVADEIEYIVEQLAIDLSIGEISRLEKVISYPTHIGKPISLRMFLAADTFDNMRYFRKNRVVTKTQITAYALNEISEEWNIEISQLKKSDEL